MNKPITVEQQELCNDIIKLSEQTGLSIKCIAGELVSYLKEAKSYAQANGINLAAAGRHFKESGKLEAFQAKIWQIAEEVSA